VLGTAKAPDKPLEMAWGGWGVLEAPSGRGSFVAVECGFRGSETQIETVLRTDPAGIHGTTVEYACPRGTRHELSREEW
jgi:hypothetical protein